MHREGIQGGSGRIFPQEKIGNFGAAGADGISQENFRVAEGHPKKSLAPTAPMIFRRKLLGEDKRAYIQYNCDNHITEGAYKKVQEEIPQLESVESMVKIG